MEFRLYLQENFSIFILLSFKCFIRLPPSQIRRIDMLNRYAINI
ncbi:MAG: hypothetical protein QW803_06730 [Candidatus Methanomethylicia archaeon]